MRRSIIIITLELFLFAALVTACNNNKDNNVESVQQKMQEASESGMQIEGKFVQIKKINDREYDLYLKVSDTIAIFRTLMPLDEHEIALLKKDGNNIKLTYEVFTNRVPGTEEKRVKFMEPLYEGSPSNLPQ